jgi:hypothetical protein
MMLCAGVLVSGCMQIETVVKLNQDGSALITERLRLSKRLLAAGARAGGERNVARFLTREAALKRMASMGTGLTLKKHERRDLPTGDREATATFKLADINDFRYVSPWLGYADYPANNTVKCVVKPSYSHAHKSWALGLNFVNLKPLPKPESGQDAAPVKGPSPLEMQAYRDLAPLVQNAFEGFHVKFTFESYAPIQIEKLFRDHPGRCRGKTIDLIDFSWDDRDTFDQPFLENEEALLDIMRLDFISGDIESQTRTFRNNPTLPVFRPRCMHRLVSFAPSRILFDKYFKDKKLETTGRWARPRPVFEKCGWKK